MLITEAEKCLELPPRARRIPLLDIPRQEWYGTTSACAENTWCCCWRERLWWNYLRVRGEYLRLIRKTRFPLELPPRARRILDHSQPQLHRSGTTSACAENTRGGIVPENRHRNYLRVRGEYTRWRILLSSTGELPPRARRIPITDTFRPRLVGTTSACAENTATPVRASRIARNYLRVRGEYSASIVIESNRLELPPRARRIPLNKAEDKLAKGTTSACAENTTSPTPGIRKRGNYLRVRGEYWMCPRMVAWPMELPPRARRILGPPPPRITPIGTTSACAENTVCHATYSGAPRNYLRVRGEYTPLIIHPHKPLELPPRARRIRYIRSRRSSSVGTTSACAENTFAWSWHVFGAWNYLRVRGEYPK